MVALNKEKIIKNAQKYVAQGKLENAVKEYEKLLEQEPGDPPILNTVGDLNQSMNRTQTAINFYKQAAQRYIDDGFYSRGLAIYRKIVRADSRNLENKETLADLFFKEGILSDAKKIYAEVGLAYFQSNNFTKSYQVYKKLGDLTQDDHHIHLKLAELSIKINELDNARESYLNAATICSRKGDIQPALNSLKMALEIDPFHVAALKLLFKISLETRDFQFCLKCLLRAYDQDKENPFLLEMLGQTYMFLGDLSRAYVLFNEVYKNDEKKYVLILDLAEAALRQKKAEQAIQFFDQIIHVLVNRKENNKIIEFLKMVLTIDSNNVSALRKLAEVYNSLSDNFNYVDALDKLVEALISQGELKEALEVLENLLDYDSANVKYRRYHKEVFQKLYPNEAYTPYGSGENTGNVEGGIFEFDTAELAAGKAMTVHSESDAAIEIELLMSYGLRDKAKVKMLDRIQEDPSDTVFREKLKELYKEEGNLKQAADLCFELANIYALKGETEKGSVYLEEGKHLDPSREQTPLSTSEDTGQEAYSEETDISTTGFDLMDLDEDAIDLTNDLSDILVGMDDTSIGVKAKATPPPVVPIQPESKPVAKEDLIPAMDTDINMRLEETLKSLADIGLSPDILKLEPAKPAAKPKAPSRPAPPKAPEPEPFKLELMENPEDAGSLLSLLSKKEAPLPEPDFEPPPPPARPIPPLVVPEPIMMASASADAELEINLREIDFYIKLGFNDNAREELLKLQGQYPDQSEISSRLQSLGVLPAPETKPEAKAATKPEAKAATKSEAKAATKPETKPAAKQAAKPEAKPTVKSTTKQETKTTAKSAGSKAAKAREDESIPPPTIQVKEIAKEDKIAAMSDETIDEIGVISPEDVNIDLFNFISSEPEHDETGRPSSTYDAKKSVPELTPLNFGDGDNQQEEAMPSLLGSIEPEEIVKDALFFGEVKTSSLKSEGLYLPESIEEELEKSQAKNPDKNITAMHNIFSDLVEEANKVFVSNVEEEGDFDTHYNLGIAYKEMGLLDDAIGEFQKAWQTVQNQSNNPQYIMGCHMLSLCFLEKGLSKSAIKWCEKGLQSPGHQEHEYQALKYDMAQAHEKSGDLKKALEIFGDIYEVDVNYQDVAEKINELRKKVGA